MTDRSEEDVKVEESAWEALVKAPNRPTDLCHTHLRWLTGTDASLENITVHTPTTQLFI